ncbi:hypothetical protein skT53_32750 [Effusibacillus dendaii]|uniref:Redoxin domain-containing protein n=1 Tax=Effusibacillus dendaii TaxID=2743772 RepID=A0A7I8DI19_9BACL|nr:hypothetical protein skT53_32750 [Effusibacillus dendaii]
MNDLDGKQVKISELKGEKLLLNFWVSWCPPCKAGFLTLSSKWIGLFAGIGLSSWIGSGVGMLYFVIRIFQYRIPLMTLLDIVVPPFLLGVSAYSIIVADYGSEPI